MRANQYVIMVPLPHCAFFRSSSPLTLGEREVNNIEFPSDEQIFDWFDLWLKDTQNDFLENTPKVQYFTFGVDQWRSAAFWPPNGSTRRTLYFSSDGKANSLFGDGTLTGDPPMREAADHCSRRDTVFAWTCHRVTFLVSPATSTPEAPTTTSRSLQLRSTPSITHRHIRHASS